jgi:M6 family metalloprotease-like protein
MGAEGETRSPDYQWVGVLGYVIDPAHPQPLDTVPLYSWYSPGRGDNFITSDGQYRPRSDTDRSRSPDYGFVRLEGYLYDRPLAGTVPLQSHWSAERGDNFATTHYSWIGEIGKRTSPDYKLYRTEGYVIAPRTGDISPSDRDQFGIGRATYDRQKGVPVSGKRPLLVIMTQYSDVALRHTRSYYASFFFSDPNKSVMSYFREMSRGRFEWVQSGLLGPYTYENRPETSVDESKFYCLLNVSQGGRQLCPGASGTAETNALPATIRLAAQDIDFSRFDTNPRDGKIETHELGVVYVGANPPRREEDRDETRFPVTYATNGSTRDSSSYGGCFPVSGVLFCARISSLGEGVSTATAAHEMFHLLATGTDNDIYGSGSSRASLMGATIRGVEDQTDRYHLDAWHKMRAGWAEPLIRPIVPEIPPDSAHLVAPAVQPWLYPLYHPVLLFDPRRGPTDTFLMEHRRRQSFDADVADEGLALWFARVDNTLNPFETPIESVDSTTDRPTWSAKANETGQTLWVVGAPRQTRGLPRFWRSAHGEVSLRWYPNPVPGAVVTSGAESGLRFRVGPQVLNGIDVEWRFNDDPFLARIDNIKRRRNGYVMGGNFGLRASKIVRLEPRRGGAGHDARIVTWQADVVEFEVPEEVPEGEYVVRVYTDETRSEGGNRRPIAVSRGGGPF